MRVGAHQGIALAVLTIQQQAEKFSMGGWGKEAGTYEDRKRLSVFFRTSGENARFFCIHSNPVLLANHSAQPPSRSLVGRTGKNACFALTVATVACQKNEMVTTPSPVFSRCERSGSLFTVPWTAG